ncbi:hypothetical protein ADL01_37110 [Streptomyces sp. NRRL WC-3618]|uniref:hypothetical protein n=1 Tax=Streptomyces sp. NRRL WC-3618 TaxID=1519490 RepID=UPI0006AD93EE|nr:hypothetical protein [Streptomyces sp. NRRL WC-3618]KOV58644.1 hypothetical protein ADL01_37110 [Streptomyces sp. NRRL WC-3618]
MHPAEAVAVLTWEGGGRLRRGFRVAAWLVAQFPAPLDGIVARASEFPVAGSAKPHQAVRVSTHLFHQREDVGRVVDALWQLSGVMS